MTPTAALTCAAAAGLAAALAAGGSPARRLRRVVDDGSRPARELPREVILALVVAATVVVAGLPPILAVGAGAPFAVRRLRRLAAPRERPRDQLPETLGALAAELRAGHPLPVAIDAVAAEAAPVLAAALRRAGAAVLLGQDAGRALTDGTDARTGHDLRPFAACLSLVSTGGALAAMLERLAGAERSSARVRGVLRAELAGPRSTAALLAGLPVLGLALSGAIGSASATFFLRGPAGVGCLAAGVALEAAGLAWARRITMSAGPG